MNVLLLYRKSHYIPFPLSQTHFSNRSSSPEQYWQLSKTVPYSRSIGHHSHHQRKHKMRTLFCGSACTMLFSPQLARSNRQTSNNETQLEQYLSKPVIFHDEDPLLWWRQNKEWLPHLARLVHVYLGPPPTSVPSQWLFSVAGKVVGDHKCALLPDNASRSIFLKYNAKLNDE